MISRWDWIISQVMGRLWVWAAGYGVLAVVTALAAIWLAPFIPEQVSTEMGADAVEDILQIIATSMLAVATFSLSTMVSAFSATTNTATPRAAQVLIEDRTAQNAIATFVGAFVYSLVGIVALRAGLYGSSGRLVLFGVTVLVILAVVITLFRWIDYLSRLGRLSEVVSKVEKVVHEAVAAHFAHPYLKARSWEPPPTEAHPIPNKQVGYVRHLDIESLAKQAGKAGGQIYVAQRPGAFVEYGQPLAWITWPADSVTEEKLRSAFLVGSERSFRQDPRFGLIVLAEIASRALSPGINDPGTAIDILGRIVRILSDGCRAAPAHHKVEFEGVFVPPIRVPEIFDDVFSPIARDGAHNVEVGVRLQRALVSLARLEPAFRDSARTHSILARERADPALLLEADKQLLRAAAAEICELSGAHTRTKR